MLRRSDRTKKGDTREDIHDGDLLDAEMMLVDGCFILEILYKFMRITMHSEEQTTADPIFGRDSTANTVQHDLLLFENQIPFLVLEHLFELTVARIHKNSSLTQYVSHYFANLMSPERRNSANINRSTENCCSPRDCILWVLDIELNELSKPESGFPSNNGKYSHILHMLHDNYCPRGKRERKELGEIMPSASELAYLGVKFVPGTGNDLFKVKFTEPKGPFWWCLFP